jgi:hypothetical protein
LLLLQLQAKLAVLKIECFASSAPASINMQQIVALP